MNPLAWKSRGAGGIDPGEDIHPLLGAIGATLGQTSDWDIAHAAYVFDYLASEDPDPRTIALTQALATEYAQRFAEWLGYVFLDRANLTRRSKVMAGLEEGLGQWVEAIPSMLGSSMKAPSTFIPAEAGRFFKEDRLDSLGERIFRAISHEWAKQGRQADAHVEMPITWNAAKKVYEIPKSNLTFENRNKLRALGFEYEGNMWYTDTLDTHALADLGLVARIEKTPAQPTGAKTDPDRWFFEQWLPPNIQRFSKAFNEYGRAEGVAYSFKFQVTGHDVNVVFTRNITSIPDAIAELTSRYGADADRDGWMLAISCYNGLRMARGKAAIHAIDMANNLEHSHGAMMEHFPPGIRRWYPRFLDFKYTAGLWQMIRVIHDEDIRVVASALMPLQEQQHRLMTEKTDYRTPKGLALEISSQPGKPAKKKMLKDVQRQYPDMAEKVQELLEARGLYLTR